MDELMNQPFGNNYHIQQQDILHNSTIYDDDYKQDITTAELTEFQLDYASYQHDEFMDGTIATTTSTTILSSIIMNNNNYVRKQQLQQDNNINSDEYTEYDDESLSESSISPSHSLNPLSIITSDKVTKPQLQRRNLIIWDWDDTLFPTHSFRTYENKKDPISFMNNLSILIFQIEYIFTKMIKIYGRDNIIIITNASHKWINKCLNVDIIKNMFKNFKNNILRNITQISASDLNNNSSKYPNNYIKWKEIAFKYIINKRFAVSASSASDKSDNDYINSITSIGDSLCEYIASDIATKSINNRILNRIRFQSNPNINDIILQLKKVIPIIHTFGVNKTDMEIDFCTST